MRTKDRITDFIDMRGSTNSTELSDHLGISRQAVAKHLRALVDSGAIVKTGSTRGARYHARSKAPDTAKFSRQFDLTGLDESRVYAQIAITLNLRRMLRKNVESIVHYGFTEILNNAIDHSGAQRCRVKLLLSAGQLSFEIRETGIGVFASIAQKLGLESEQAAMIELIKGKTTTMPEAHSGEGIFFTSKIADRFSIRSHKIHIEWHRKHDDVFVSTPHYRKGTTVVFEIQRDSRTRLEDVFNQYAPEIYDYRFQKTRIQVKLLATDYISRSEAKRLLHKLDTFIDIELDFAGVDRVGQAFADEVFRVFAGQHPAITIKVVNASANVAAMIRHAGGSVSQ